MRIRDAVRKIPFFGPLIRKTYFTYRIRNDVSEQIHAELAACPSVLVIQIGSNDGKSGDPLFALFQANPTWQGLFVEPVPILFQRLRNNYGSSTRFRFENAAITSHDSIIPFYVIATSDLKENPELPTWYDQIGSFSKEHITRLFSGSFQPKVDEILVRALRFESLLLKHKVKQFELLHIDAEGSDWNILRQVDLERYAPKVILFEHQHLSSNDRQEAFKFLSGSYQLRIIGYDCMCIRKRK